MMYVFLFCEKCGRLEKIELTTNDIPHKRFNEFDEHGCLVKPRHTISSAHHTTYYTVWDMES